MFPEDYYKVYYIPQTEQEIQCEKEKKKQKYLETAIQYHKGIKKLDEIKTIKNPEASSASKGSYSRQ